MNQEHIVMLDAGTMGADFVWPDCSSLGKFTKYETTLPHEVNQRVHDATILLSNKVIVGKEAIQAAPKLRYIGSVATGYNQIDIEAARACHIPVCNAPGYSTYSVMQHTFALLLDLASSVTLHVNEVRQGEWARCGQFCFWKKSPFDLQGKTLGVVGFGHIGSAVARMGHLFGMNVVVSVPRPKPAPDYMPFAFVDLETLLATSDVISLHCPLTAENTEMINARTLAMMKRTALLINCSRGALINEHDLYAALVAGTIGGAGLDVVQQEPMQNDNILLKAPNCLITPHMAWSSMEARTRLVDTVLANVRQFLAGTPVNVVN